MRRTRRRAALSLYRELGYPLVELSARTDTLPFAALSAGPSQRFGGSIRDGKIDAHQCAYS